MRDQEPYQGKRHRQQLVQQDILRVGKQVGADQQDASQRSSQAEASSASQDQPPGASQAQATRQARSPETERSQGGAVTKSRHRILTAGEKPNIGKHSAHEEPPHQKSGSEAQGHPTMDAQLQSPDGTVGEEGEQESHPAGCWQERLGPGQRGGEKSEKEPGKHRHDEEGCDGSKSKSKRRPTGGHYPFNKGIIYKTSENQPLSPLPPRPRTVNPAGLDRLKQSVS